MRQLHTSHFHSAQENDISKQEQLSMRILVACWTDLRQAAQCVHSLDQLLPSTRCMVLGDDDDDKNIYDANSKKTGRVLIPGHL